MRVFSAVLVLALPLLATAMPKPDDDEVSGADITRSGASSYDNSNPQAGADIIKELFGGSYKPPKNIKVDSNSEQCTYYENDGYKCVPYHLCDENGEIIVDGGSAGLIDLRFGGVELDPENSKCPGSLEVCCRHPDYTAPVTQKPQPYTSRCGTRNINGIGVRIINDQTQAANTQFGEFPYMCAILEEKLINGEKKNLFVAGASLIAPGIAMTAGHSVYNYTHGNTNPLKVRCGEWDTQKTNEPAEHQDRYVKTIKINPGYSNTNYTNNIALLFTEEDFILSAHIDVICLPNLLELQDSYQYENCIATGWGKDRFDSTGKYQVILKKVDLDLVPPSICQSQLRQTKLGEHFNLDPTFVCAGGQSAEDTCKGDGGGPLICPSGKNNGYGPTYVQAGIVAWGVGCGELNVPGVYTDVADMLCFIDWATRCELGDDDHYKLDIKGCRHWATREANRVRAAANAYQYQMETAANARQRRIFQKRFFAHKEVLDSFETAIQECKSLQLDNQDDFSDYDDSLDLSGYQRINERLNAKANELNNDNNEEQE